MYLVSPCVDLKCRDHDQIFINNTFSQVVGVMMTPALPLSLIPLGTPTGLIVNVGYHDTSVICVYEGMILLLSVYMKV